MQLEDVPEEMGCVGGTALTTASRCRHLLNQAQTQAGRIHLGYWSPFVSRGLRVFIRARRLSAAKERLALQVAPVAARWGKAALAETHIPYVEHLITPFWSTPRRSKSTQASNILTTKY